MNLGKKWKENEKKENEKKKKRKEKIDIKNRSTKPENLGWEKTKKRKEKTSGSFPK